MDASEINETGNTQVQGQSIHSDGAVQIVKDGKMRGWALRPDGKLPEVSLAINHQRIGTFVATIPILQPKGAKQFVISVQAARNDDIVALYFAGTDQLLSGENPYRVVLQSDERDGMFDPTREEIGSKIEAMQARAEARTSELLAEVRAIGSRLDGELESLGSRLNGIKRATYGTKTTIIVTAVALFGAVIAVLVYGQQWFGVGGGVVGR